MTESPLHGAVILAQEVLAGKLDILNGCARLVPKLTAAGLRDDPMFVIFLGVWSESDHLPFEPNDRRNWASEALKLKDQEIVRVVEGYRDSVLAACRMLVNRFGNESSSPDT